MMMKLCSLRFIVVFLSCCVVGLNKPGNLFAERRQTSCLMGREKIPWEGEGEGGRGRGRGDRGVPGRARVRATNLTIDMPPGGLYNVQCTLYTCTLYYAVFYLSTWISVFSGRAVHRRGMAPSSSSRSLQTEMFIVSSSSGEDNDEWDPTWKVEWWNGSEV